MPGGAQVLEYHSSKTQGTNISITTKKVFQSLHLPFASTSLNSEKFKIQDGYLSCTHFLLADELFFKTQYAVQLEEIRLQERVQVIIFISTQIFFI